MSPSERRIPEDEGENVVLVVDDDPAQADQVASYLRRRGMSVITENKGDDALGTIKARRPAVLITDIRMPGFSGISLVRALDNVISRPRIILVSAFPDSIYHANQAELDISAVLDKPLRLSELAELVNSLIEPDSADDEPRKSHGGGVLWKPDPGSDILAAGDGETSVEPGPAAIENDRWPLRRSVALWLGASALGWGLLIGAAAALL